ncbi:uncharacterized protein [Magallana gigas]|uniref:uncharacterized protein isoform X2 n=1 Tax=Magallana gigas TaxID=29159 RepID=UPI00333E1A8A
MAAMAFATVWILIFVPFISGYYISVSPTSFPIGKRNVTIQCRSFWWYGSFMELTLEIRQNENEDFISVIKCNDSGIYRLNNETQFKGVTLLSYRGDCSHSYYDDQYILLTVSLQSDKCAIDSQISASTRCLFSNNAETFNSSERDMYSIKGQPPENILEISIINRQQLSKSMYETDDVLQLQCIGEVENINSMPTKDIRWCKKEKGKFNSLQFQDPPRTNVVERSKDGCTVVQNSVLFYHVTQNNTDLEIMCESGWGSACGIEGINATLSIPTTDTQPNKWRMLPILIHDKKSSLNPGQIVLDGSGKTIHLHCTASVYSHNTSLAKMINWCVRKQNDSALTKVNLQGKKKEATSNISGEITIFSKIEYHVTTYDTDVHFMCEVSHYSSCGNGLASSNISIHVVVEEAQNRIDNEPDCSKAGVAVLSVLFVVVVISTLLFFTILCRRRQISLFVKRNILSKIKPTINHCLQMEIALLARHKAVSVMWRIHPQVLVLKRTKIIQ